MPFVRIAGVLLAAVYPFAVYFLLKHGLSWAAGAVIALASLFVWLSKRNRISLAAFAAALILACVSGLAQDSTAVKLYPVVMNACWLASFAFSLASVPAVEFFARIKHKDLPPAAVVYCRKATFAWCIFFLFNGLAALDSALFRSDAWWALYNGAIAYALIALMFAFEYIVRRIYARMNRLP